MIGMAIYPRTHRYGAGVFQNIQYDIWACMAEANRIDARVSALSVGTDLIAVGATADVVAGRAVTANGKHASAANAGDAGRVIGIAAANTLNGGSIPVVTRGAAIVGGFVRGDVLYLAADGQLTTSVPAGGFQQRIGVAISGSLVVVSLSDPIVIV
jgi:hypothetical protein